MKTIIPSAMILISASIAALACPAAAYAQDASFYPVAKQSIPLPINGSNRGFEKSSSSTLEAQQTCPQPYGDAWDTTSDQVWNVLEFGIQVKPEETPRPKLQFYTRYTCAKPLERPFASR